MLMQDIIDKHHFKLKIHTFDDKCNVTLSYTDDSNNFNYMFVCQNTIDDFINQFDESYHRFEGQPDKFNNSIQPKLYALLCDLYENCPRIDSNNNYLILNTE